MDWRHGGLLSTLALGTLAFPSTAMAERVVFINTNPVDIVNTAGQDPTQNSYNTTGFTPGMVSGWPALTDEQQQEYLYWLKEASVPFDIIYTFERPAMGNYDMIAMGSADDAAARFPGLGCSAAIGLADCDDANVENISFLFWGCLNETQQMDMHRVAFNTFAALGFGWGLENLSVSGQIMGSYTASALEFGDTCVNISGTQNCLGQHPGCADPQQNSTSDLLARLGARVDDGPPFVAITSPEHDSVVEPNITVTAAVGDLFGGLTVQLEIVEAMQVVVDEFPPYEWNLEGIPQGTWTLRVTATDADMNEVMEEISICVDLPACGEDPVGTSTGGESTGAGDETGVAGDTTSGGSSSTGEEPDDDPPSLTTGVPQNPLTFGGDTPETGCQCRADGDNGGGAPAAFALLLLLGALTRRE